MSSLIQRTDTAASAREDRHGPLPALLFVLTAVTGLVDAVSYLQLGHVFVANIVRALDRRHMKTLAIAQDVGKPKSWRECPLNQRPLGSGSQFCFTP